MEALVRYPRLFASLVKIEHTVFALPFAYVGAFLAVDGVPSAADLFWVTVAMVGARSLAMALNRLIDAEIDARNPRTAGREIPRGALSRAAVIGFCLVSLAVFLVAVSQLAPLVRWLWPIPVAMFVIYPYLKRVTWLAHGWLGAVDGLAPLGAWIAVTNEMPWEAWALGAAVAFWVAGFDLLYALFDLEIDRAQGLHSFPTRFGVPATFWASRACHVADGRVPPADGPRPAGRRALLARRRRGRGPARVRALARLAARPAAARRGVLHHERRHLADVPRLLPRGRAGVIRARGLERRFGDKRVLTGLDLDVAANGFLVRRRPERLGEVDAARALSPGCSRRRAARSTSTPTAREIGYLAHEALVYRELTALENLELYGRLYRVPERRERIGMLLERYGLWEVAAPPRLGVLARDDAAARALPDAPP